ncbi:MAG: (Fe-S)-binding protein [Deltaproteobacteria bacterium]|nr:(Fe-S)-binding protein [Deltaproteobacteria bacterium]
MGKNIRIEDISRPSDQLSHVDQKQLPPLPAPLDNPDDWPEFKPLKDGVREKVEASLDDTVVLNIPRPKDEKEEKELVEKFLSGLEKLFTRENNWAFLMPLTLTMEHCAKCQTCSDSCHIYEMSGKNPIYRPTYRAEVLRRLYYKFVKGEKGLLAAWRHGDIELNWTAVARLAELAYRCNLCRRCAQTCPLSVDNGLVAHDLRKLFSQEMNISPRELHRDGTMLQMKTGSSTGMNALVVKDNIEFVDEDTSEKTGLKVETPWDVEGADVLLMHNAGEILAWPENPGAFAVILNEAGINWTLSSELAGYDSINYGLFYDDVQLARTLVLHAQAAKKLGVKKIVLGECGHASKSFTVIGDRILTGDLNVPRESALTLLEDIVMNDRIKLDPSRNDFAVTLHDPCNIVRLMGIVEPQRNIVKKICPRFREMEPHGVDNYCCGGGSGFAIMGGHNFPDWRHNVSGRKKLQQILEAFSDCLGPDNPKYVCAPCSNCKGQIRDMIAHYDLWEKEKLLYGGLVELIVNAMVDAKPGYIEWEWH